jgi:hypothetical protein
VPNLVLEEVDAEAVGVDLASGTVPDLLLRCLAELAVAAVVPERATLVVSGDFVGSVRRRLGDHPSAAEFDLARGSGSVGAKTMLQPDGSIHVIVPWYYFSSEYEAEQPAEAGALILRTVVHEAQHVAMHQNAQGYERPKEQSWRDANFTSIADSVIDEYRAELGVIASGVQDTTSWSPLDVLDDLASGLGAAAASYQSHLDVERLIREVGAASAIAWRLMGYIAAAETRGSENVLITPEVLADPRWLRGAATSWTNFRRILDGIPPGREVLPQAEINVAVVQLADVLASWLADLGFVWTGEQFRIEPWYFEDEYFLRAMRDQTADAG